MIAAIMRWVRQLTTSRDNETPDVIRIGGIVIGFQFAIHAAVDLFMFGHAFSPSDYGAGAAAILAAIGAALALKRSDEPGAE